MTMIARTDTFILPRWVTHWSCGGCHASYVPYDDGDAVVGHRDSEQEIVRPGADGFYSCYWCPDRRFRWEK